MSRRVLGRSSKSELQNTPIDKLQRLDAPQRSSSEDSLNIHCPICHELMVSLSQLNRHLDDVHTEIEVRENQSWLKLAINKGRTFDPVKALHRQLKPFETFERNGQASADGIEATKETDSTVSKSHWQKDSADGDICAVAECPKKITSRTSVNCRHCGKLFCNSHTLYQMKLSRSAIPEPVHGIWCRVCINCYTGRDAYLDSTGIYCDKTNQYSQLRRQTVDKIHLEVNRLESRLTKLLQKLAESAARQASSFFSLITNKGSEVRAIELSIVPWEAEGQKTDCPICKLPFSYINRKHHCRLCGRVICGDPILECSYVNAFFVNTGKLINASGQTVYLSSQGEKHSATSDTTIDVRICRDCKTMVFGKQEFLADTAKDPTYIRLYKNLTQFRQGIETLLPRFQKLLAALNDPTKSPTHTEIMEAGRIRRKLRDAFSQYDATAKKILHLPTHSQSQQNLQKAIWQRAAQFLQINMVSLQAIPRAPPKLKVEQPSVSEEELGQKQMREELMAFREQRFLINEQKKLASRHRRFDEFEALENSLVELDLEIASRAGALGEEVEL